MQSEIEEMVQEDPREVSCVSCFQESLSCLVVLPMESPRMWCFTDPVPGPKGCGQEPSCARAGLGCLCRPTALLHSAFPPTYTEGKKEGEEEVVKLRMQ